MREMAFDQINSGYKKVDSLLEDKKIQEAKNAPSFENKNNKAEAKNENKWNIELVIDTISGVYEDYKNQKEKAENKNLKFNSSFFYSYSKYSTAYLLANGIKRISKQAVGEEMDLQGTIERLALDGKLKSEILEVFERQDRQSWTIERVIDTINRTYEDYLEQKKNPENKDLKFNSDFFRNKANYLKASSLATPKRITKQVIGEAIDLQELIERLVLDGKIRPEILEDFNKKEQQWWTFDRVLDTINGVYGEYLKQKKIQEIEDLKFNQKFFLSCSNYPKAYLLVNNIKEISKKTVGEELSLQELIEKLVLDRKINLEIIETFEKREQQAWTLDRAVETINGVYEDYLEMKKKSRK